MKTVAYQGVKGAFSYITALMEFGIENNFRGCQSFQNVFELVDSGEADYAVIPVENSLVGSIYDNYDLLNRFEMEIVGERFTKIEHCLLAVPAPQKNSQNWVQACDLQFESISRFSIRDSQITNHKPDPNFAHEERLAGIIKVMSHPKALEQCSSFFQGHPWMEAVVHMDTAAAAAEVAFKEDPSCVAIASSAAAELYGLEILKKGIEDDPKNYTRFVTIVKKGNSGGRTEKADKCSLLIKMKHIPEVLVGMLKHFADEWVNVTKIESRPIRGSPFEYLFYIDFEFAGREQQEIEVLLNGLGNEVQMLKILGFYKKGMSWSN